MPYAKERNLLTFLSRLRFVAACVLGLLVSAPHPGAARRAKPAATGLPAIFYAEATPDFAFDAGGGATHLAALAGRPVVLSFWATWCEPCRAELPALGRLRATYGDAISLLTISDEPPGQARAFLRSRQLDLPVVEDPERKIFGAYTITPIPVTLVLLADGTVAYVSIGETSWDELANAVAGALIFPVRSVERVR